MVVRFQTIAAIALAALLTGCGEDEVLPSEITTVRLTMVHSGPGGFSWSTPMRTEVTETPLYRGDPDGVGEALITIKFRQREVCWTLRASRILLPGTAAHIHQAPVGVRGPIVVTLSPPNAEGTSIGCVTDQSPDLLESIVRTPAAFYVNVHTTEYPAGAVRGQLRR
jgi:hypothetical protein